MCSSCRIDNCWCQSQGISAQQNAIRSGAYLSGQQAQGALGIGLCDLIQGRLGLGNLFYPSPPSVEEINKIHWNPKYPPTTAETYGEFGTAVQTDSDNRMFGRERNTKDMFQVRRFIEDQNNKERRAAYDKWIERKDFWNDK